MVAEKMATTTSPEGSPEEESLSPPVENALNETLAPLNFCELTPSQFGISVQSFTPASSSPKRKDKSRLAQIKARRRSTIGVRGSPETNSLIRYMAQQRMKTPPPSQTPEPVRSSPFLPRVASTLRQKMAAFQSLMDVEESDDDKSRDYLYAGSSSIAEKENQPVTPTPNKRMRLDPSEGCGEEIREAAAAILRSSLKEQEVTEDPARQQRTRPLPCSEAVEEAQAVLISSPFSSNSDSSARSRLKKHQGGVFEVQSPIRPPPVDPANASPSRPLVPSSLPSLLEMKPAAGNGTPKQRKRKQVRFGGPLSPEVFDKNLPPSTPLQKGGTPARAATPGDALKLRSLLKTPQRSESTATPPGLCSPTEFSTSPAISIPHSRRKRSEIVFPSLEENDSAGTSDPEPTWDAQPLNLDTAFFEESLLQAVTDLSTDPDGKPSELCHEFVQDQPASPPRNDEKPQVENPTPTRSSKRTKKTAAQQQDATSEPAAVSSSRKRKLPEESEPVKRSTRSAAISASGKMKMSAAAARRFSKDVDHSLYGSREYASKKPGLSPITESLLAFSFSLSPAAEEADEDINRTRDEETTSEESTTSPKSSKGSSPGKRGRPLASRGGGRGRRKRRYGVSEEASSEEPEENTETTSDLEVSIKQGENHLVELNVMVCEDGGGADGKIHAEAGEDFTEETKRTDKGSSAEVEESHQEERSEENVFLVSDPTEVQSTPAVVLAPWQAHFDFEDVFKPVATRGQRSVRRSLRNRGGEGENDGGAGLAWLPHTSPESIKEARRRTRGRRLSAAALLNPPPEETTPPPDS